MAEHRPITTAGVIVLAVIGGAVLSVAVLRWSPDVPTSAAGAPLTETVMTGPIAPDVREGTDIALVPRSPAGDACLPRVERSAGFMDVCWRAHRYPADGDPDKDYYLLEVFSTFGSGVDGSPRWAMLKADLVGSPAGNVFSAWPDGGYDGECQTMAVPLSFVDFGTEAVLCGHVEAHDAGSWARDVTWTCRGCLFPDDRDRSLSLYVEVGVTAGTVPVWEIYADFGGRRRLPRPREPEIDR